MNVTNEFYAYSWHIDEEYQDETFIRIYGFDDLNRNICVSINGFRPFAWVELPTHIAWDKPSNKAELYGYMERSFPGVKCTLKFYKKLYGANLKKKEGRYTQKLFPFLRCSFSSYTTLKFHFLSKLKSPQRIMGLGSVKMRLHGQDACPRLQLTSKYNLPTAGWIKFKGVEILGKDDKFTSCDREFLVNLTSQKESDVRELISASPKSTIPKPLVLSFDLEVNSEDAVTMPKASRPGDVVFQISCVFSRLGSSVYDKYLLSLGNPKEEIVGANVRAFSTEKKLLMGFRDIVNELNPNVIIGYNIFNFDIPYLMDRANHKAIYPEWSQQGFPLNKSGIQREIKWSSSAYKNQEFKFLDCEGRLYIDLLPVVQRDFKLNDYKLKTVSTHFIGETKDDLDPKSIFRCYREGIKDSGETASKYMSICGKYCMQDSMLVMKLMEKLSVWYGLSEMAVVCNVPMVTLFTKGQQIKVYSKLYKYCLQNKIVPEKDGYAVSENERYVGAYVFTPKPGLYENVVPLDFCVAGDTLVSLSNGLSCRMENMNHNPNVLAFNPEEEGFLPKNVINGLQVKGEKNTVKVTMKDGREIVCTPDHKFMLVNGEWCEAQNLLGQRVKCGVEFPEDINYGDEEGYNLTVVFDSDRTTRVSLQHPIHTEQWNMIDHRDKILAFARILGFIYADGSIYKSKGKKGCVEAYVGTKFDVDTFQRDLTLFNCVAGVQFKTGSKGSYYRLNLPARFASMIHSLSGITVGKRTTQPLTFPDFLMDDCIPKSVIREFLGGLFGGDGCAPCVSSNGKTVRRILPVRFKWDTCFPEEMNATFKQLCIWLKIFGLNPTINTKIPSKSQFSKEGRTSLELYFPTDEVVQYHKLIGFRYCINKSYRLTIISSYLSLRSKVSEQFDEAFRYGLDYLKNVENKSNKYKLVCDHTNEYLKSKIVLDDIVYMTPLKFVNRKIKEETNPNKPYTFKSWLTIDQYLDELEVSQIFDSHAYSVSSHYDFVPAFSMEVLDVNDFKMVPVYDIEVESDHNFLANGMVITNCSLYPSLIISYNIDYSTCAFDPTIPDELCHVMEWEDHISCKHDPKMIEKNRLTKTIEELLLKKKQKGSDSALVSTLSHLRKQRSDITKSLNKNIMCEKRKYRFLKVTEEYPEFKGVLPTIVQSLLDARKETRKEISRFKNSLKTITNENEQKEVETTISILNQRQLAYKVSANSMYGITGVKAGMLPFMPVAMSITYMGRENILKAAEYGKQKFNGQLIYIDTDSNYFSFPDIKSHGELWDFAIKAAAEISTLFPPPMKLEFEEAIYTKFLILTKKRYMYKSALQDGTLKPEIGKRGVVINRRDNSAFIRNTYENMVKIIFDNTDSLDMLQQKVCSELIDDINRMFTHGLPAEDFVITKSTGDYGNLQPQYFLNDKGLHRAMLGQYNVPFLTDEIRNSETTPQQETEWYLDKLPAHIQLLEKIKRRGHMSNEGSRLEYVIVETNDLKAKQCEKIETLNYYNKNKDILSLDYLYYLHRLINPVDQILEVVFDLKDFMKTHYNHRLVRKKLTLELNNLFAPQLDIETDHLYLLTHNSKYWIAQEEEQDSQCVLKMHYVPKVKDLYSYLKAKYGPNTSLKTQFVFEDGKYILLGDMTESKLVSAIKRICSK